MNFVLEIVRGYPEHTQPTIACSCLLVSNRNIRKKCEICSQLTIKTLHSSRLKISDICPVLKSIVLQSIVLQSVVITL